MVQQYESPIRVYKYPFELVMAAYEKRFPTCPMIPVFVGSETMSEYKSPDGAVHIVERRCKLNLEAPYILKKIVGVEFVYFIQKNSLDRRARTLKIQAHNESFSSRIIIREDCLYSVHPENPNWTCFEQSASLDVLSFFGFEATVEKLACKHYAANIRKGKEIIQYYIDELITDGIILLPTWEEQCSRLELLKVSEKEGVSAEEEGAAARVRNDSISSVRTVTRKDSLVKEPQSPPTVLVNEVPKIDEDYIARCLGPLNPVEESRLMELRKWISEIHKDKMPNDAHLLRFLRAREFNMEKARDMLHRSLLWRKQHQIDRLLSAYKPHHVIIDYFPGCWHHHDKEGRPLYVLRLGLMDFKGLLRSVGEDDLLRHVIATCEEGLNKCEKATRRRGKPISSWTGLVDLEGLSMRHLWRPGIKVLLRIIEVVEANYPETMGRLLIVRAPRVFPILWTLVSPFIDENTRNKFLIYGGNDYQGPGGLVDYIDAKYIPDFLGGDSMCEMPPGGTISKTLYQPEVDSSDLPPLEIDSIYHSSHIFKGVPHEVVVPVTESGTVITWDFDVMKNDCVFALLKTKRPVDIDVIAQHSHIHGQHGQHGPASPTLGNVMDRPLMALGVEAYNAESPLVCREGDSIQGSHVAGSMGTYVLQWKYREPSKVRASSAPTFDFSLTTHKCKIMYFYELLESAEFKGSMTSLQSCQSGFSSLSVNTSTSERSGISGASASCPSR